MAHIMNLSYDDSARLEALAPQVDESHGVAWGNVLRRAAAALAQQAQPEPCLDHDLRIQRLVEANTLLKAQRAHPLCGTCGDVHVEGKFENHNFVPAQQAQPDFEAWADGEGVTGTLRDDYRFVWDAATMSKPEMTMRCDRPTLHYSHDYKTQDGNSAFCRGDV